MLKRIVIILYIVAVVVMAAATIIEKDAGTAYVQDNIYGSWWFALLWGILTATGLFYIIKRRVRRVGTVAIHIAFAIILVGAVLTHFTAQKGSVHLRLGYTVNEFFDKNQQELMLPFAVQLDSFEVKYHEGTSAAADYLSHITITSNGTKTRHLVSMNNIAQKNGVRLYQGSYDSDGQGSTLIVNTDPYGIPVTYTGYALLFLSLLWMLIDPRATFRQLLRSPLLRKEALCIATLMLLAPNTLHAVPALPKTTAEKFGHLNILYNDRICPMQTFAIDFTKKLYGKSYYSDFTAEQVLTGFIFWPEEWNKEPIIKIKGGELRHRLSLPKYAAMSTFFDGTQSGYKLGPYVQEYYQGQQDAFHKQAAQVDDKLMLLMDLRRGVLLKVFPYNDHDIMTWYAPTSNKPLDMDTEHRKYIESIFSVLNQDVRNGSFSRVDDCLDKMLKYQYTFGAKSIPSPARIKAERIYNRIPFATILFMANLTMGLLCLLLTLLKRRQGWTAFVMVVSFIALTICLALRWIISGTVPMSNGYETMLFMAWCIMLMALLMARRVRIMLMFGFLMSGFFLLVSHISQMDPQITHLMPVLASPLLTIHVSVIMMSFALLSLTFICGLTALCAHSRADELMVLSQLFLYPALTTLGLGIFIGAIWANVSWGEYWSWDPKEVWALITLMVYAVAVHRQSLPWLRQPLHYHLYVTLAFLTILMTYFGVNYFLGGMHSYA